MKLYTNCFIDKLREYQPSEVILQEKDKSITTGYLMESSKSLAKGLLNKGVRKGDRVVLALKPGVEFLQVMYANMMVGTVLSIIDPEMGRENYLAKLRQFSPQHAFVDSRLLLLNEHPILKFFALRLNKSIPFFPWIRNCTLFAAGPRLPLFQRHTRVASLTKQPAGDVVFDAMDEREDFLVTYTSGTLNEPKGVVHSYTSLANSIKYLTAVLQRNSDKIIATHLPHFALIGINAGIRVHLWDHTMQPAEKIRFLEQHNITTLFGPPSDFVPLIDHLNNINGGFPKSLVSIYLGSAPIYKSFLSRLVPLSAGMRVSCLYGMTENLMVTLQDGREKLSDDEEGDLVGTPFPGVDISIADDGEVRLRSDQMFSHYWQSERQDDIHLTGDLGRIDKKGRLVLIGRKKDMIIRGNFNIYPGLYEPTISRIKGVSEAVMIGVYDKQKADEEVVLVIDAVNGLTKADVMKQLASGQYSIDSQALPDRILFMRIPHSGRQNKVDRKALASMLTGTQVQ
jgi:acyl-CoA synthetase (AMP-forming)/AMP-acid ligase II